MFAIYTDLLHRSLYTFYENKQRPVTIGQPETADLSEEEADAAARSTLAKDRSRRLQQLREDDRCSERDDLSEEEATSVGDSSDAQRQCSGLELLVGRMRPVAGLVATNLRDRII
jgi:hypothetical protein